MEGGTTAGDADQAAKDQLFQDFRNDVKKRIEEHANNKGQDEESDFNTTEEAPFMKVLFK